MSKAETLKKQAEAKAVEAKDEYHAAQRLENLERAGKSIGKVETLFRQAASSTSETARQTKIEELKLVAPDAFRFALYVLGLRPVHAGMGRRKSPMDDRPRHISLADKEKFADWFFSCTKEMPPPKGVKGKCLIWQKPPAASGYGQVRCGSKFGTRMTHWTAWFLKHGKWPKTHGKEKLVHECGRKLCCEAGHLKFVESKKLLDNKFFLMRTARLTKKTVKALRRMKRKNPNMTAEQLTEIARRDFGIEASREAIYGAVSGRTWQLEGCGEPVDFDDRKRLNGKIVAKLRRRKRKNPETSYAKLADWAAKKCGTSVSRKALELAVKGVTWAHVEEEPWLAP